MTRKPDHASNQGLWHGSTGTAIRTKTMPPRLRSGHWHLQGSPAESKVLATTKKMKISKQMKQISGMVVILALSAIGSAEVNKEIKPAPASDEIWTVDFIDEFETFNPDNWQDQMIWVNNETQCYVPDGEFGTREVSNGTLKLKVVNIGEKRCCDNFDKHGKKHPDTEYVAGRICSKNKKEFIKGKWTAKIKLWSNGEPSMFPAWWLLGARNNEPPVQEPDENIPWPITGSGEIDIFEHHGDSQKNEFTTGAIKSLEGADKGDWWSLRTGVKATLNEYHEYSVEWEGSDLVYRLDGKEVHRNVGQGDKYPEPMFAILNFAKITDSPMKGEWVMEVDWVKHEYRNK